MNLRHESLQDLSPAALVTAIEASNYAQFAYLRHVPHTELHESPDLMWFVTGAPIRYFNGVVHTQWREDEVAGRIEETLAHFQARQAPMLWWVTPSTQPANLGQHLAAHGLAHAGDFAGMAVDLLALNEEIAAPPGLTIERVRDRAALHTWVDAACSGFGFPAAIADPMFEVFDALGLGDDVPLRRYLGRLDGAPVATSSLFLGAGVAGINYVATDPAVRGQGIGAHMTLAPVRDGRTLGYRIGVLESTPMGSNVYRRLGFQTYCDLSCYAWPA